MTDQKRAKCLKNKENKAWLNGNPVGLIPAESLLVIWPTIKNALLANFGFTDTAAAR
jgi:hypothetical protein